MVGAGGGGRVGGEEGAALVAGEKVVLVDVEGGQGEEAALVVSAPRSTPGLNSPYQPACKRWRRNIQTWFPCMLIEDLLVRYGLHYLHLHACFQCAHAS